MNANEDMKRTPNFRDVLQTLGTYYIKGDLHFNESMHKYDLPVYKTDEVKEYWTQKEFKKQYVYNALTLEGSTYTFDQVSATLDGEELDTAKTEYEVAALHGMSRAIDFVIGNIGTNITRQKIEEINLWVGDAGKIIDYAGSIRGTIPMKRKDIKIDSGGKVFIGISAGTNGENLVNNFDKMLNDIYKLRPPLRGFVWSANATLWQYFKDGNKRTARLTQDWINANNGYLPVMISGIDHMTRYEYALRELFWTEDATKYIDFMFNAYIERYVKSLQVNH
ncbi:MAG: hypothetical protein LBI63_02570 [Candidatus Ancillula sp.]|jgi:Fic family protein|nr:hypothetical protein [Candidatus Ancillula sp.]